MFSTGLRVFMYVHAVYACKHLSAVKKLFIRFEKYFQVTCWCRDCAGDTTARARTARPTLWGCGGGDSVASGERPELGVLCPGEQAQGGFSWKGTGDWPVEAFLL